MREIKNDKKHAYLVIAHTDAMQLKRLLKSIDDARNDIYVHLDSKWNVVPEDFSECVGFSKLVFIERSHPAWGGSRLIRVELALINAAYQCGPYAYYHLLSGQDFPVKSQDYIHNYFNQFTEECFLQKPNKNEIDIDHPRYSIRYEQYHFLQDCLIGKKRNGWKYIEFAFCYLQKAIGIRRFKGVNVIAAWQWFSLPEAAIAYLANNRVKIGKRWRFTYCCDELFVPTELARAGFSDLFMSDVRIRFAKWSWQGFRDYSPIFLTEKEENYLQDKDILFARKFRSPDSDSVMTKFTNPLHCYCYESNCINPEKLKGSPK